jgi:hypothetical protein
LFFIKCAKKRPTSSGWASRISCGIWASRHNETGPRSCISADQRPVHNYDDLVVQLELSLHRW